MMHDWEAISKTRASCFIGVFKHSKTIKALGLRPRAFISFLVFGNPDETLALILKYYFQVGDRFDDWNQFWKREVFCSLPQRYANFVTGRVFRYTNII